MIGLSEASGILSGISVYPGIEILSLNEILGRVLARDIVSRINMPPFDKSAMDGFAISSKDGSERFRIVEIIPAGQVPEKKIKKGECSKIMTGAMLPRGADRVIKKEITRIDDGYMIITGEENVTNVCSLGEDVKIGDTVLKRGTLIRPAEAGIIASMGIDPVSVYRRPIVGLLPTGSEIIEPGQPLKKSQIYNSNAFSLSAQLNNMGLSVIYEAIAGDQKKEIRRLIETILKKVDLLLISGGVSMGDYDYIPQILEQIGVKLAFTRVAIKPGKPTVLGTLEKKIVIGLPGNPVSTFIIFEIFVKPLLYRMMGHQFSPFYLWGTLNQDFNRKKSVRSEFIPVVYESGTIEILEYHGSAHIHSLSRANSLLEIPAGVKEIKKGTEVNVRSL